MQLVVTGAAGNIGRRVMAAFPGSTGIDRRPDSDIVADLRDVDYDANPVRTALANADGVVHLATSPEPDGPDDDHYSAVINTARLVDACQRHCVPRLVLASSDWAEPTGLSLPMTTYEHSKRVFEALAANYWSDERLISELRAALGG